jgi:hypothetical protein
MHTNDYAVIEIPVALQATTADPFIADIAVSSPDVLARLEAFRARVAAGPRHRIYD